MVWGRLLRGSAVAAAVLALAACAGSSGTRPDALPESGVYKIGKPYQVNGVWYYPAEDWDYDETGLASWYGTASGDTTANGERHDPNQLTAAHKTLPMPSLVRVTNLENGRSVVVRVNDRGPFVAGRVIDLTRRGAQLLGFEGQGVAKVRVQILAEETRAIAAAARRNTPAALLAESEAPAPAPRAAPRARVEVASAPATASAPAAVARPITPPTSVAGSEVDGRFLPAPVVAEVPVRRGGQIYVQAGAFQVRDNAQRLQTRLAALGPAQVSPAVVGGQRFYRVRLGPIAEVAQADALLGRVIQAGHGDAKIVVD